MRRASLLAAALAALATGCVSPQPCPTPLESCGGVCFDLQSDRLHCGSCAKECPVGFGCSGAVCVADPLAACPVRVGGAFVTLGVCGATVKLWATSAAFIDRAIALRAAPGTSPAVPVLDLRAGGDCDGQWTWSTDPATATFQPAPPVTDPTCDACPADVEANAAVWISTIRRWCPSSIATATVLAVDPR